MATMSDELVTVPQMLAYEQAGTARMRHHVYRGWRRKAPEGMT